MAKVPIPDHVRIRDRGGHRCEATHPTKSVQIGQDVHPVRCKLVENHVPKTGDPSIRGHWSCDGEVETEW
jgi:hypothetical protein